MDNHEQPPAKRQKIESDATPFALASLSREISPPPRSNAGIPARKVEGSPHPEDAKASEMNEISNDSQSTSTFSSTERVPSPFQLTRIRDLPESHNIDTVSLTDLLGDPLIKECWQFNYLFDVDFVMNAFDEDVRGFVDVKIVHGSWKTDSSNHIRVAEAALRYPNVTVKIAHMPEVFGTHHTKMMIILRHDDTAQVVIHTANMIHQDWTNMTQAVWRSQPLPFLSEQANGENAATASSGAVGTGERFKVDLLRYLKAYEGRTRTLVDQLKLYDFSSIKAALIASTPNRVSMSSSNPEHHTSWGWPGLQEIVKKVPCSQNAVKERLSIILQCSSISTLTNKWLSNFLDAFCPRSAASSSPFLSASTPTLKPKVNIVFPTPEEIRHSLEGYQSGTSIHTKIQSPAQMKQLTLLRPMFCHWTSEAHYSHPQPTASASDAARRHWAGEKKVVNGVRKALRGRAAPHIKTYIRFSSLAQTEIDWAIVTSANISQQAWGALPDKQGEVRVCSYEIGVVVWPDLFRENEGEQVKMVPVFGADMPKVNDRDGESKVKTRLMGMRMPYDLPLTPYGKTEDPWCATMEYSEPDWRGETYGGYRDT
ncbi:phospholipase D/nuclease [Tothia fuscella]|uniref:Phospholipase D/nuclease n=1 Tax=Tothia fuscella TaxID=1048955 RepID=A0A9P4U187_9PEZI|nr:phospholipase D/nuclease [Tothia fuscella]